MDRELDSILAGWTAEPSRKPIVLRGARQTGKTFAVRKLGKSFRTYVEVNFEKYPDLGSFFEPDLDPIRLCRELSLWSNSPIEPGRTLLFFDEVQNCPKAITALRYFHEEMPGLHVISAGSLLEFALGAYSVPVGRVEYLYVRPFTFAEFLSAIGRHPLAAAIRENRHMTAFADPIHRTALGYVRQYCICGGMPGVVARFRADAPYEELRREQESILQTYVDDFVKYTGHTDLLTARSVFRSLPVMVGRRTTYSEIADEVSPYRVKKAIEILEKSMVVCKVRRTGGGVLPLGAGASDKHYKSIFLDVGLMQCAAGMPLDVWVREKSILGTYKGGVAEQFVGQELLAANSRLPNQLFYWHREKKGALAEVDYVIQYGAHAVPVEVKSSAAGHLKSMQRYLESYPHCPTGLKVSEENYTRRKRIQSVPLYGIASLSP